MSDLLTGESQARTQVASPALAVTVRVWREVVPVDVEPDPPHPDTKPPTINANMLVVRKFIGQGVGVAPATLSAPGWASERSHQTATSHPDGATLFTVGFQRRPVRAALGPLSRLVTAFPHAFLRLENSERPGDRLRVVDLRCAQKVRRVVAPPPRLAEPRLWALVTSWRLRVLAHPHRAYPVTLGVGVPRSTRVRRMTTFGPSRRPKPHRPEPCPGACRACTSNRLPVDRRLCHGQTGQGGRSGAGRRGAGEDQRRLRPAPHRLSHNA